MSSSAPVAPHETAHMPGSGSAWVGLPDSDLNRALASPLVTNSYPIAGPNVSQSWPGNEISAESPDPWTISLKLATDVSIENSTTPVYSDNYTFVDIVTVSLDPPSSLLTTLDNGTSVFAAGNATLSQYELSWYIYRDLEDSYHVDGRDDDGSCTSVFSKRCLSDILSYIQGTDTESAPESCKPRLGESVSLDTEIDNTLLQSPLHGMSSDTHAQGAVLSFADRPDSETVAGGLRGRVYPVFVKWGSWSTAVGVVCAKVESAETAGDVNYGDGQGGGDDGNGGGSATAGPLGRGSAVVLAGAVAGLVWLW